MVHDQPPLIDAFMAASETSTSAPPLGKFLASNDKPTRDKAIKNLSSFLSNASIDALGELELAKLWKGIWYCFWMSDKPLVQQALAKELAELTLMITNTAASLAFLRAFWMTTVREWNGIDRFRLDKYYMLVRRFVNAAFRLLMRDAWAIESCNEWNSMLMDQGGPLCANDIRIPGGLTFHLIDVYLEELEKILPPEPGATLAAPLPTIVHPFFILLARTPNKSIRTHIQSEFLNPLLRALQPKGSQPPPHKRARVESEAPSYQNIIVNACSTDSIKGCKVNADTVRERLLKKLLEISGEQETKTANRKLILGTCKEYGDVSREKEEYATTS